MNPRKHAAFNTVIPVLALITSFSTIRCNCEDSSLVCESDQDCVDLGHDTPFCVDAVCVECRDGADCRRCSECRDHACEEFQCCEDAACGEGSICENHRCTGRCASEYTGDPQTPFCVPGERWVQCRGDFDCPEHNRCDDGMCIDTRECASRELETIFFDFDESLIRHDQEARLGHDLVCLTDFPDDRITIEGHSDEQGTDAYNMALGERRARSVFDWMLVNEVEGERMDNVSYGESRPANPGHTESAWSRNRRVELVWR